MNEAYLLEDDEGNNFYLEPDPFTESICIYKDMGEEPLFSFAEDKEIDRFCEILKAGLRAAKPC